MELSVLQTFVDVVKQGSFAAVARERNVDPSSVSRAIAGLEEELVVYGVCSATLFKPLALFLYKSIERVLPSCG
jgi:hypothetical protein